MQFENSFYNFNQTEVTILDSKKLSNGLKSLVEKIAKNEGYTSYKIINRSISTDGGNYLGILHLVDIKGKINNKEKETNIFIKQAICQEHINILSVSEVYSKELFFYGELSKLFTKLEDEAAIPHDERFKSVKFYNESSTEAIILQNLAKEGYGTLYRMDVIPLKFAELSIQQLARFHAFSFILEQKIPEYYKTKIKTMKKSMIYNDEFKNYCERVYTIVAAGLDNNRKMNLEGKFLELFEGYEDFTNGNDSKIQCLCHGDYRINNILMKASQGIINEVIPVDYQLLYYGSPMTDFIYFMFSSTDKKFRSIHLQNLKDLYFNTMKNSLQYYCIDINLVYPRKKFETDYDYFLPYGLQIMVFMMPFTFTLESDVPDLNKDDLKDFKVNLDQRYYNRLSDIIDEMIDYGKL